MNMFITRRQVLAPNLGHHQAIIIHESEYTYKLKSLSRRFPVVHQSTLRNMYVKKAR
jgi:hypothetical protein